MRLGTLVVAHDLTPRGDRTLQALAARGVRAEQVHVVHALPRLDPAHPAVVWSRDEDDARRRHALDQLRARLASGPFPDAAPHVTVGDPASRLVDRAKELGADLLAITTRRDGGVERLVLGSVALHVLRFAPCPVLVLHDDDVG